MPRGGENHAQGGGKSLRGGEISPALRARRTVWFFPPLGNFSCTPLSRGTKFKNYSSPSCQEIQHLRSIALYLKRNNQWNSVSHCVTSLLYKSLVIPGKLDKILRNHNISYEKEGKNKLKFCSNSWNSLCLNSNNCQKGSGEGAYPRMSKPIWVFLGPYLSYLPNRKVSLKCGSASPPPTLDKSRF